MLFIYKREMLRRSGGVTMRAMLNSLEHTTSNPGEWEKKERYRRRGEIPDLIWNGHSSTWIYYHWWCKAPFFSLELKNRSNPIITFNKPKISFNRDEKSAFLIEYQIWNKMMPKSLANWFGSKISVLLRSYINLVATHFVVRPQIESELPILECC